MADVAATTPSNTASDPNIDDGEEEESKVCARVAGFRHGSAHMCGLLRAQEILLMKQRVEEMEREANKLRELQAAAEKAERGSQEASDSGVPMETEEDKAAADSRSIFVGNVRGCLGGPVCGEILMRLFPLEGGLFVNTGGDPAALPGMWGDQPGDHPL